ncbi:MAG: hypothetical protein IPK11_01020 [Ignavibacteria bacterium]|nr:hypothetical protein [Ignavibacteria bacterium]
MERLLQKPDTMDNHFADMNNRFADMNNRFADMNNRFADIRQKPTFIHKNLCLLR